MSCKACGGAAGLEVCLHCGHSYCGNHRGTYEGGVACTGCLKAEQERKAQAKRNKRAREERQAAEEASAAFVPEESDEARPLPPLPEPAGWGPVGLGLGVGGGAGAYAFWLFRRLATQHELAAWTPVAGAAAVGLLIAFGVWAIAKTRARS